MPAQLVALNQSAGASGCDVNGGIQYSWLVEAKYVSAITQTAGVITGFTMTTPGKWKRWDYDRDNTSKYTETDNGTGKKRSQAQVAFMKFGGIDNAIAVASSDALLTCDIIAVHVLTNGVRLVQGLEISALGAGGFRLTTENTLLRATRDTDTSAGEARTEFSLTGVSAYLSPPTTITDAAIAAL